MKKIMIEESLYEFAKRGRPKKRGRKRAVAKRGIGDPDAWSSKAGEDDEEGPIEDIDVTDMTGADVIEIEEDVFDDELLKALNNEIKLPEFSRRIVKFRVKGDLGKVLWGVPMANLSNKTSTAFLFKLKDGSLKKIFLRDMVVEHENKSNRAKMVSEIFSEIKGSDKHGTITNADDNWRHDEFAGKDMEDDKNLHDVLEDMFYAGDKITISGNDVHIQGTSISRRNLLEFKRDIEERTGLHIFDLESEEGAISGSVSFSFKK